MMETASIWLEFAWLIPLLPLLAAGLIVAFAGRLPERGGWLAVAATGISFLLSVPVIIEALSREAPYHAQLAWFAVGGLELKAGLYIDRLAALMLLVVGLVSTLVLIYSTAYMHEEGVRLRRYYAEMSLFIGSMLGLVLADNYLQVYIFWELVGLCSYLLIGFWYERPTAAAAAFKAFIVTRVGDLFFLAGVLLMLTQLKALDFPTLFAMDFAPEQLWIVVLAGLLIFGGAVGKSAQFPLHIWLPDAMEGPTTVSALIHAATMVKAGVYLIARSMPLLVQAPTDLIVIAVIGGFTAFLAATMACVNFDIKRVLAYSTISQLGYMFLGLGAGGYAYVLGTYAAGYTAGLFHLMTHAFFKALLFLSAGSVMHALAGTTDLRKMGGLFRHLKLTAIAMLIGAAANAGLPPTSGFFSKDELLAAVLHAAEEGPPWLMLGWALGFVTVALTAFYLFRLWFMAFTGRPRWEEGVHPHESPPLMTGPLGILAALALIAGGAVFWFGHAVAFGKPHVLTPEELLQAILKSPTSLISIALVLAGIALAYGLYVRGWSFRPRAWAQKIYTLLHERYYLDHLAGGIAKGVLGGAIQLDDADRRGVDGAVNALAEGSARLGAGIRRAVTGYIGTYAAWTVLGVLVLWLLLAFGGGR